jgi:CRISPR/Cas system CSM-associated protein Csm3 (group 7 of RAMP superfamily)
MARPIESKIKVKGTLVAESALHVGGAGAGVDSDMALAINGRDQVYIPGTSITGVVKDWCRDHFKDGSGNCSAIIADLFGYPSGDTGSASLVLVEDAILTDPDGLIVEVRDGVGIDRFLGTAADGAKFDREIIPKGTKLNLEMSVEILDDSSRDEIFAVIGHLIRALSKGEVRFGAARTRGLGKARLELPSCDEFKYRGNDKDGTPHILNTILAKNGETIDIENIESHADFSEGPHTSFCIEWKRVQPVMVKAEAAGVGVDVLPLVSRILDDKTNTYQIALVIPGSSIKGAFRAQAEVIMNTLTSPLSLAGIGFHEQISIHSLVQQLFGSKAEADGTESDGRGAAMIDDCYSKTRFKVDDWEKLVSAPGQKKGEYTSYTEQEFSKQLIKINAANQDRTGQYDPDKDHFKLEQFTSIDRFVGGAAETALFNMLTPHDIDWEDLGIHVDVTRLRNVKECLSLLLHVIRDMANSRMTLGYAGNRGMGEVEIEKILMTVERVRELADGAAGEITVLSGPADFFQNNTVVSLGGKIGGNKNTN